MEQKLKAGDTVRLKSGGPLMTIEDIGEYSYETKAKCSWFDGLKRNQELFSPESLNIDEDVEE